VSARLTLLATALTALALSDVLPAPTVRLAGGATVDAFGTWWFQWWVSQAARAGASLEQTSLLFFPWGKDILAHTGANLLDALLVAPIRWAAGAPLAWNALAALALLTNGLAAGGWARRHGEAAAAVAVAFATLNPFPLHEIAMGRPTQAILAPLLGALAFGDAALRGPLRWRDAVVAGALLALQGWFYWYAAGFGALALCILAVGRPFGVRLARLGAIGVVSLALTAPVVVPLLGAIRTGSVPGLLPIEGWIRDGASFTNAEGGTVQLGTLGAWGVAGFLGANKWAPEGLSLGLAGIFAVFFAPRRWKAVAAFGLLLALGPFPLGARNWLYLGLARVLSPMERLYWPIRALAIVIPAGLAGIDAAWERIPPAWRLRAAIAAIALLVAEPFARGVLPLGTWEPTVPAALACLKGAEGAVITLPYGVDQEPLVYQTVHGLPMLNGMHERSPWLVPPEQQQFRASNGWMRAVLTAPADPRDEVPWTDEEKEAVRALGYRFVVLRPNQLREAGSRAGERSRERAAIRRLTELAGAPVVTTDDVVIFAPWGGMPECQ
jgi:hypothetical protein